MNAKGLFFRINVPIPQRPPERSRHYPCDVKMESWDTVTEELGSEAGDAPTRRSHRGTAWSSTGKIGLWVYETGREKHSLFNFQEACEMEIGSKLFQETTSKASKTKITLMQTWTDNQGNGWRST